MSRTYSGRYTVLKFRRRFVLIATASFTVVLALLVIIINLVNTRQHEQMLDSMLDATILRESQGSKPKPPSPESGTASFLPPDKPESTSPFPGRRTDNLLLHYFTVRFDEAGNAVSADTASIPDVTAAEALDAGNHVMAAGKSGHGWYGQYRYLLKTDGTLPVALFLDSAFVGYSMDALLAISAISAGVALLAVFCAIVILSRRAIRPFTANADKQRRFVTDAGHELKTPLTVISASAELLHDEIGENVWLTGITEQTARMRGLITDMITLARADEAELPPVRERFRADTLVTEVAAAFEAPAAMRHMTFLCTVPDTHEGVFLTGDEPAMRRLLTVLADNAVRHGDEGSTIRMKLAVSRRHATVTVENDCAALDVPAMAHWFDRFYRADSARGTDGGYGLGLSVAGMLARRLGATIAADSPTAGIVRMSVTLRLS